MARNILGKARNILGKARNIFRKAENILGKARNILGKARNILGMAENILGKAKLFLGKAKIEGEGVFTELCLTYFFERRFTPEGDWRFSLNLKKRPSISYKASFFYTITTHTIKARMMVFQSQGALQVFTQR